MKIRSRSDIYYDEISRISIGPLWVALAGIRGKSAKVYALQPWANRYLDQQWGPAMAIESIRAMCS